MTMTVNRIEFYGKQIEAVEVDGRVWIILKQICHNLGIDARSQRKKVKDNPAFEGRWGDITLPSAGGPQRMFCLDLDAFSIWLGMLNPSRVKESIRAGLILYQRECMRVLREYFFGPVPSDPPTQAQLSLLQARALVELEQKQLSQQAQQKEPWLQKLEARMSEQPALEYYLMIDTAEYLPMTVADLAERMGASLGLTHTLVDHMVEKKYWLRGKGGRIALSLSELIQQGYLSGKHDRRLIGRH